VSAQTFEITLARLYTDPKFRSQFLENPEQALQNSNLTASEQSDLLAIDRTGLLMASRSFLHKRKKRYLNRLHTSPLATFIARIVNLARESHSLQEIK
jgi:hypothetical protein